MHQRLDVQRVSDSHLRAAILIERQGVLTGRNVASVDAAQPEAFQMAHQTAVASDTVRRTSGSREGVESAAAPP